MATLVVRGLLLFRLFTDLIQFAARVKFQAKFVTSEVIGKHSKAVTQKCFVKKGVLKKFRKIHENTLVPESLF